MGDFGTLLTSMDRSSRQKSIRKHKTEINKETQDLNDILDPKDLIDVYRAFHPKAAYTHSFQGYMDHSSG